VVIINGFDAWRWEQGYLHMVLDANEKVIDTHWTSGDEKING